MSDIPEHASEPVRGLPEVLPEGERILWQGRPDWQEFAIHALHVRKVAIYFLALLLLRVVQQGTLTGHGTYVILALSGVGLLLLLARFMARSALYTITNRRVVMRFGIAIPISINLPFNCIDAVEMRRHGSQSADIVLASQQAPAQRLSFLIVWPHARPWRIAAVQPMMRCIAEADTVADILCDALQMQIDREIVRDAVTTPAPVRIASDVEKPVPAPAFPMPPLLGAAALLSIAIVSIAWYRFSAPAPAAAPIENAVASVQLEFVDGSDGAVLVYDATTGAQIDELPAGTNNFLRATLRGLVRGRNALQDPDRSAFGLYQIADGRLLLVDPVTGSHVDLWAFGKTNASAFETFLHASPGQLQVSRANERQEGT